MQTKQEMIQRTPTIRERLKTLIGIRAGAKQQALQQIGQQESLVGEAEAKLSTAQREQRLAQEAYKKAFEHATQGGALSGTYDPTFVKYYNQFREQVGRQVAAEISAQTYAQQQIQLSDFLKDVERQTGQAGRIITTPTGQITGVEVAGQSIPTSQLMKGIEIPVSATMRPLTAREQMYQKLELGNLEIEQKKPYFQKIYEKVKQPISEYWERTKVLPTVTAPVPQITEGVIRPATWSERVFGRVPDVVPPETLRRVVFGREPYEEVRTRDVFKIPLRGAEWAGERTGEIITSGTRAIGIPEVKQTSVEISPEVFQRRTVETGRILEEYGIPKVEREVTVLSPEIIGKGAGFAAEAYALGAALRPAGKVVSFFGKARRTEATLGMTQLEWENYQKALRKSQEALKKEQREISSLWGERLGVTRGEVYPGLEPTLISEMKGAGVETRILGKKEVELIAEDLVQGGVYKSKKSAIKAVLDAQKFKQTLETQLPKQIPVSAVPTDFGLVYHEKPLIATLPGLKESPWIGKVKTDIYGLSVGLKTPERTKAIQFVYQKGVRGKPISPEMQLVEYFPKRKQAEIFVFKRGRASAKGIEAGDMFFKKYTKEPYRYTKRFLVDVGPVKQKKAGEFLLREYKPIYKEEFMKPKRITPLDVFKKWKGTPSKVFEKKGKTYPVEKQKIREVFAPSEKGMFLVGAKAGEYPKFAELKMAGKFKGFVSVSRGVSKGEMPIKTFGFDIPKPKQIQPSPIYPAEKQILKLEKEPPKLFAPTKVKFPKPRIITRKPKPVEKKFPTIVGGLGATSLYRGKGLYERTVGGLIPKTSVQIEKIKPEIKFIPSEKVLVPVSERVSVKLIPKQISKIKPSIKVFEGVKPREMIKVKPREAVGTIERIIPLSREKISVRPGLRTTVRVQTRPKPPRVPPPTPPIITPIKFPEPVTGKVKKPGKKPKLKMKPEGFEVFVKRRGKEVKVSPFGLGYGEALALGRKVAKETAAAQFFLKPTKGKIGTIGIPKISPAALTPEFRPPVRKGERIYDPFKFVQRRSFRIGTLGEKREITFKGIEARRKSIW